MEWLCGGVSQRILAVEGGTQSTDSIATQSGIFLVAWYLENSGLHNSTLQS